MLPLDTLSKLVEGLPIDVKVKIPGILVIDTPGHEAFFNLRRRGGSIANFAILVVDVTAGVMPQTVESIEILRSRNTPFIVAANKIDLIKGWQPQGTLSVIASLGKQSASVKRELEVKVYQIIGRLSELNITADLFSNVKDFERNVAVIPVSAKTGEGISELIAIIIGMTQSFLAGGIAIKGETGRGVVLEVLEEIGLGTTMNVILYDGKMQTNDIVVLGGFEGPIVTKVKGLLMPKALDEIRDPREKFKRVDMVEAAVGVKVLASGIEKAMAGSPLISKRTGEEVAEAKKSIEQDISGARFVRELQGLIVKADTLGSLEALVNELETRGVKMHSGDVGDVSRRDVVEASSATDDITDRAILVFNVHVLPEAREAASELKVKIFEDKIIYGLIDSYMSWKDEQSRLTIQQKLQRMTMPGKLQVLPGYTFRRSKPAIVGVRIIGGSVKPGSRLITASGRSLGEVQQVQSEGQVINSAELGKEVAISLPEAIFGRDFEEDDVLYVDVPNVDIPLLKGPFKDSLPAGSLEIIEELIELRRRTQRR